MLEWKNEKNKEHMMNILVLYGLRMLNNDQHGLYECGYFISGIKYSELILEAIKNINLKIRPIILPLVETFAMKDDTLLSAIGNSYGDIYETHLEWAKGSRLNKNQDAIPDGFIKYMMPILKAKM